MVETGTVNVGRDKIYVKTRDGWKHIPFDGTLFTGRACASRIGRLLAAPELYGSDHLEITRLLLFRHFTGGELSVGWGDKVGKIIHRVDEKNERNLGSAIRARIKDEFLMNTLADDALKDRRGIDGNALLKEFGRITAGFKTPDGMIRAILGRKKETDDRLAVFCVSRRYGEYTDNIIKKMKKVEKTGFGKKLESRRDGEAVIFYVKDGNIPYITSGINRRMYYQEEWTGGLYGMLCSILDRRPKSDVLDDLEKCGITRKDLAVQCSGEIRDGAPIDCIKDALRGCRFPEHYQSVKKQEISRKCRALKTGEFDRIWQNVVTPLIECIDEGTVQSDGENDIPYRLDESLFENDYKFAEYLEGELENPRDYLYAPEKNSYVICSEFLEHYWREAEAGILARRDAVLRK